MHCFSKTEKPYYFKIYFNYRARILQECAKHFVCTSTGNKISEIVYFMDLKKF